MTEGLLRDPVSRVCLRRSGPLGLRLLQFVEPLIERFEPCVGWKLSTVNWCIGSILPSAATLALPHHLPVVVPDLVIRRTLRSPTPNPKNSISNVNKGKVR